MKGKDPGNVPIQQATKFDLIINLHTARALGIEIPPKLLVQGSRLRRVLRRLHWLRIIIRRLCRILRRPLRQARATCASRPLCCEWNKFGISLVVRQVARQADLSPIGGARLDADNAAVVDSQVVRGGSRPFGVEWHLRRNDGEWRVVDLVIEGISVAITQRSEFSSVINGHGGSIEGLLSALRQRTARL